MRAPNASAIAPSVSASSVKFRLYFRVEAHAADLDSGLLQIGHPVAQPARFLRAARRVVLRIEINQDDFFSGMIRELPSPAVLIPALDKRGLVPGFRRLGPPPVDRGQDERGDECKNETEGRDGLHRRVEA